MNKEQINNQKVEAPVEAENTTENQEVSQSNIAHEYKQEYKNWQKLNESYQNTLKGLDSLRNDGLVQNDSQMITKLEGELKSISSMMEGSQINMNRLFSQLSDESKEKYLKPEEPVKEVT